MKNQFVTLLSLILLFCVSCKKESALEEISQNGIWMQLGYGKIFEIKNDSVKIFDICKAGCQLYEHSSLSSIGEIESFSSDSLTVRKNIKTYKFVKLKDLPESCHQVDLNPFDPEYNFEILWNTFNEQYCFFENRNVDWSEIYDIYKKRISKQTSELEMFLTFDEMLNLLNDGHVELEAPKSLEDTLTNLGNNSENIELEKPRINRFDLADEIALQINAMWLFAYYDIPKDLPLNEFGALYSQEMDKRTFQRQDEIDGANLLMDTIINEVKHADALIIDLRFNTGGKDEVGLEIIGQLVDEKYKVASKKAKLETGFTNHQNINLESRTPNFKKNVFILTSSITASAAEIAVLATLSNNRFLKLGSNTEGAFSDGLDKRLPIGWEYTLSNEVYEDLEGNNYEGIGINPDIDLNYPKEKGALLNFLLDQLNTSGDAAIEKVFDIQKK